MIRASLAVLALAMLAGCGNDTDETLRARTAGAYLAALAPGKAAAPVGTLPGLTRAAIEITPQPLILVINEKRGTTGVMDQVATNGAVQVWTSGDPISLALRGGDVIVGTRGLGGDLMSAVAPTAAQLAAGGSWTRLHVTLNGEDQIVRTRYTCTAGAVGPAEVVIVERRYATRLVRETCTAEDGSGAGFQNEYWFDGGPKIRQSRQWIGPVVGHVAIRRLSG